MAGPADVTEVVPYLTTAATIVYIQKWLKTKTTYGSFVKAFPGADKWAHRFVGGVGAFIMALGIHMTWNWNADTGGAAHFTIPGLIDMFHGVSDWFKVYILQHTIYESTTRTPYHPPPAPEVKP